MSKQTGRLIAEFEHNTETDDLICVVRIQGESTAMPFDVFMRAYLALGSSLHKQGAKMKYGIESEEDNEKVCKRIESEFEEERWKTK